MSLTSSNGWWEEDSQTSYLQKKMRNAMQEEMMREVYQNALLPPQFFGYDPASEPKEKQNKKLLLLC